MNLEYLQMNAVGGYVTGWTGTEGSKADKRLDKVAVALVKFDLLSNTFKLCSVVLLEFTSRKHFAEKIQFTYILDLAQVNKTLIE